MSIFVNIGYCPYFKNWPFVCENVIMAALN